jgi:hypothetical protein
LRLLLGVTTPLFFYTGRTYEGELPQSNPFYEASMKKKL